MRRIYPHYRTLARAIVLSLAPLPCFASEPPINEEPLVIDGKRHAPLEGTWVHGNGNHAVHVLNGGGIRAGTLVFESHGVQANALRVEHAGSHAILRGTSLITHGTSAHGVVAGSLFGDNAPVRVELAATHIETWADYSSGIMSAAGASTDMRGGSIYTQGKSSHGFALTAGSQGYAQQVSIQTDGNQAYGADITGSGSHLTLRQSSISTTGEAAEGIYLLNGASADLDSTTIHTTGAYAYGINANDGFASLALERTSVETNGNGATGLWLYDTGTVAVRSSSILTTGNTAPGILASSASVIDVQGTEVQTRGERSWGVAIGRDGSLDLRDSTVQSERYGALVATSANSIRASGSLISGGNGVLLAVSGHADTALPVHFDNTSAIGDIIARNPLPAAERVNLTLDATSHWTGTSTILGNTALGGGSRWSMTGDAQVDRLHVDHAAIAFASPEAGQPHTLTVRGNYTANAALIYMHAELGGDESRTNVLHIEGDTAGETGVLVQASSGQGGQTTHGIRVIDVDGQSGGNFTLARRVVAGPYEYFLSRGADGSAWEGDWYLHSAAPTIKPLPDESDNDNDEENPPPPPPPVLRPEAGAYHANQRALTSLFHTTLRDRRGEVEVNGAWGRVEHDHATYDTHGQLRAASNTWSLRLGQDLWRFDTGLGYAGVMASTGQAHTSSVSRVTGYAARGKVRGAAFGAYTTWFADPAGVQGFHVDAWSQYAHFNASVEGSGLPRERYSAGTWDNSVEVGYALPVAHGKSVQVFLEPQAQVVHTQVDGRRHTETGGTRVDFRDAAGISQRLGLRLHAEATTATGTTLRPYVGWNWLYRQRSLDRLAFNGERIAVNAPQHTHAVTLGLEARNQSRWTVWLAIESVMGKQRYRSLGGTLGARYHW
ncbi:autotransporter family porin [Luteibacter sp. Sphag1AF]|uniref:autotransporter family protein n=1 Tax=Luteibacter sp. Sphag1AF TaxID=2587031 RepID=UPI001610CC90|nr:autotransporter outer membrane beta-barrel domain-containing protein [Luteibacter sp. Sphag1AF]MBB3227610.1 autotransporter family porin [Luteibacter sp. Sphag1AF]